MEPILQCKNISKKIGRFYLQNINFQLEPGYILGVIGRSGAGKSTLVRILLGSYPLCRYPKDVSWTTKETKAMEENKGDAEICGYSIKEQSKEYKEQVAFILHENPFRMTCSVKENGSYFGSFYKAFDMRKYKVLCAEYEVPFEKRLEELSKGQQIKMQLAFAKARDAKVFVLDEPAGNLDVKFREEFYDQMRNLVQDGQRSIVYVTHLVEELEQIADYVLWLEEGTQKAFCSMEELLDMYWLYEGPEELLTGLDDRYIVRKKKNAVHFEAVLRGGTSLSEEVKQKCRRAQLKEMI